MAQISATSEQVSSTADQYITVGLQDEFICISSSIFYILDVTNASDSLIEMIKKYGLSTENICDDDYVQLVEQIWDLPRVSCKRCDYEACTYKIYDGHCC